MLDRPQAIGLIRHARRMVNAAKSGVITGEDLRRLNDFAPLAGKSIIQARWMHDVKAVAVKVKHNPTQNIPIKNARFVEALDFLWLLQWGMLGGGLCIEPRLSGEGWLYYLRLTGASTLSGERVYLHRVIANAPQGSAVRQIGDFHSFKRDDLLIDPGKNTPREPEFGRDQVIQLMGDLFVANTPAGLDYLSREGFEAQLAEIFATADEYHGSVRTKTTEA